MLVRDCMTPNPRTARPDTTLDEALHLMRRLKIRRLPVLQTGELVGIVTWTDLMRASPSPASSLAVWEIPALLQKVSVSEAMTEDPIVIEPDVPVEEAARTLRERKIGGLPVVQEGKLVGIVTESDLFDALIFLLGGDIQGIRMTVDLPNGLHDLANLAKALTIPDEESPTLAVTVRLDSNVHRGYLRISTSMPLVVAERLAVEGFRVFNLRYVAAGSRDRAHGPRRGGDESTITVK